MLESGSTPEQAAEAERRGAPLGAHVSTAGGVDRAPGRAAEIGADAIQIFTSAPQRWKAAEIAPGVSERFRREIRLAGIRVSVAHDSYLINLATDREELFLRSEAAFRAELARAVRLGLDYVVTHPGNATGGDRAEALARNAAAVARALEAADPGPGVLFETTAGAGSALGWRFDELAALLDAIPSGLADRVGICLDTAHVFAAGYDLATDPVGVLDELDREVGLERLRLLHCNDSAGGLGSRRDRHAGIGEGEIGDHGFAGLLRDPRISRVPRVLETPKGDDPVAADRRNLDRLLALSGRAA